MGINIHRNTCRILFRMEPSNTYTVKPSQKDVYGIKADKVVPVIGGSKGIGAGIVWRLSVVAGFVPHLESEEAGFITGASLTIDGDTSHIIGRIAYKGRTTEKRLMARPKEFDQEKALGRAIRLFSRQGFAATSTDELMRVMNIGRQSMYDTFGDKRALFLKALEMYVTESVRTINEELEKSGAALAAVQNALVTFAERNDLSSAEGCMGLNAISEFGQRDPDVTRITRNAGRMQRQTLMRVLDRAGKQGELSSEADLESMADFFESTLAGIRMAAKAGKSREALRNIAAVAGTAFRRCSSRKSG